LHFPKEFQGIFCCFWFFCHMLNPIMGNRFFLFKGMNGDRGLVFGCQKNNFWWLFISMVGIKCNNSKVKVLKVFVFLSHTCVNFNHFHFFYIWQKSLPTYLMFLLFHVMLNFNDGGSFNFFFIFKVLTFPVLHISN
jgi:hypothetical protein